MSEYLNEKVVLGLVGILCLGSLGTLILAALDQPIPPVLAYSLVGILAALLVLLNPGNPVYSENGSPGTAETEEAWEWVYEDPEDDPDPGEEAPIEPEVSSPEAIGTVIPFSRAS